MKRLSILVLVLLRGRERWCAAGGARGRMQGRKGATGSQCWAIGPMIRVSAMSASKYKRVKTERQVDNGNRVTVERRDYFQLTALKFGRAAENCPTDIGDVEISDGKVSVNSCPF